MAVSSDNLKSFIHSWDEENGVSQGWTALMWCIQEDASKIATYLVTKYPAHVEGVVSCSDARLFFVPYTGSIASSNLTAKELCILKLESYKKYGKPIPVAFQSICELMKLDTAYDPNDKCIDCPVCFEPERRNFLFMDCKHSLCIDCVTQLHSANCPMCRAPFPEKFMEAKLFLKFQDVVKPVMCKIRDCTLRDVMAHARRLFPTGCPSKVVYFPVLYKTLYDLGIRHLHTLSLE